MSYVVCRAATNDVAAQRARALEMRWMTFAILVLYLFCVFFAGPADQQQQRLHSGRPAVRPEPNAAAADGHRPVVVVVVVAVAQAVGRVRLQDVHRRRPGHAAPVLGHVRQPVPAADVGAVAGATAAAAAAEVRRVRPARTAAVQRGRQGQAENRRGRPRAAVRRGRARRAQLSHRRGQAADAGHARLNGRSRSPAQQRLMNYIVVLYYII